MKSNKIEKSYTNPVDRVRSGQKTGGLRQSRAGQWSGACGQEFGHCIHGKIVGLLRRVYDGRDSYGYVMLQIAAHG